uniref:Ig-like domain-containing protein n=1 Tax=Cyprinus carpio TaxID=7962 RepID=A0A8C1XTU9_CYPCA
MLFILSWTLTLLFIWQSMGQSQITVTQTPSVKTVTPGENVVMSCKFTGWGLAWYQQKPGETPKLVIYQVNDRYGNSFSRFSGNGRSGGTDFTLTISGVQTEDIAHYYCQNLLWFISSTFHSLIL